MKYLEIGTPSKVRKINQTAEKEKLGKKIAEERMQNEIIKAKRNIRNENKKKDEKEAQVGMATNN